MITYYELLGVTADANDAQVRTAYHQAALVCHPDRAGKGATNIMRLLIEAHDAIKMLHQGTLTIGS